MGSRTKNLVRARPAVACMHVDTAAAACAYAWPCWAAAKPCTCPRHGAQQMDEEESPGVECGSIAETSGHSYAGTERARHVVGAS
jgi:hypothetical protein